MVVSFSPPHTSGCHTLQWPAYLSNLLDSTYIILWNLAAVHTFCKFDVVAAPLNLRPWYDRRSQSLVLTLNIIILYYVQFVFSFPKNNSPAAQRGASTVSSVRGCPFSSLQRGTAAARRRGGYLQLRGQARRSRDHAARRLPTTPWTSSASVSHAATDGWYHAKIKNTAPAMQCYSVAAPIRFSGPSPRPELKSSVDIYNWALLRGAA